MEHFLFSSSAVTCTRKVDDWLRGGRIHGQQDYRPHSRLGKRQWEPKWDHCCRHRRERENTKILGEVNLAEFWCLWWQGWGEKRVRNDSQDSSFLGDWTLSHCPSLGYEKRSRFGGERRWWIQCWTYWFEVSKKHLYVYVHVCLFSRLLDLGVWDLETRSELEMKLWESPVCKWWLMHGCVWEFLQGEEEMEVRAYARRTVE